MGSMQSLRGLSLVQNFGTMVLCMVLLQVLLQSLSVAVMYVYFSNEMKQMQDKYSKSSIACFLQDDESSWDPVDEEVLSSTCWQARRHFHRLLRKMILRTFKEAIPATQEKYESISALPRCDRVAAHITGTHRTSSASNELESGKPLGQKIESWESSRKEHSFLNKLHLRNGELVIQEAGVYYIYSQTYFRFREEGEKRGENKQMVQYIYKSTSYPDPIMLMKSARNSCWSKDSEYGLYSIYQGGLFQLKENDKIFVSVTNDKLVDLDQEASFFGAFLVG